MLFTIRKINKFQYYSYIEKLGSGQVLVDLVHNDTAIPESGVDLARLQISRKLRGTLHDIYTLPKFDDIGDIYVFISELEGRNNVDSYADFKKLIERDLVLAYTLAIQYLESEEYYIPSMGKSPQSIGDLMRIMAKGSKFTRIRDKIAFCTILKEVLGFFRIIRHPGFNVDYQTGKIDFRDIDFINEIITLFNNPPFLYSETGSRKFSNTSREMKGYVIVDGMKVELEAGFGVKSLYALIEKMDGQEKYNLPEAFNDIHRMRIEVKNIEEAMRIGKVLFNGLGEGLYIENVGGMISWQDFTKYSDGFLTGPENNLYREALKRSFSGQEVKKSYSEDRQEIRLKRRGSKPIEIQIVLVNNQNESGYAHHDVYKMRRKIAAKIRRHGWIGVNGIRTIIKMVYDRNFTDNGGVSTIPFTEEQIFEHIISIKGFLIGIRGSSEYPRKVKDKNGQLREQVIHYSTREVIQKYQENYPNVTAKDPISIRIIDESIGTEALVPISKISFPSTL